MMIVQALAVAPISHKLTQIKDSQIDANGLVIYDLQFTMYNYLVGVLLFVDLIIEVKTLIMLRLSSKMLSTSSNKSVACNN